MSTNSVFFPFFFFENKSFLILAILLAVVISFLFYWHSQKKILLKKVSFLNQIVHELKTPLTSLEIHLNLLRKEFQKLSSKAEEANLNMAEKSLAACIRGGDRINKLFNQIVTLNRHSEKAALEIIDPEELNRMLESLKRRHPQQVDIGSYFEHKVLAEKIRLDIILSNLISNAIRYGEKAYLEILEQNNYSFIRIKDKGPGVSVKDKNKIFTEFYRSKKTKNMDTNGLGLGLFICKKLAQEMNSSLKLKNPGKKMACFELALSQKKK